MVRLKHISTVLRDSLKPTVHDNPLKTKFSLNYTQIFSSNCAVNILPLGYKTSQSVLCREIVAVCPQYEIIHTNSVAGEYSKQQTYQYNTIKYKS